MTGTGRIDIAGLSIDLFAAPAILSELKDLYQSFHERGEAFRAYGRNPHLCKAGCSHCCKSGAVFAVTLVEAVAWSCAIEGMPDVQRKQSRREATKLLEQQGRIFSEGTEPPDTPGQRDETHFSRRVSKLNATSPACPLLVDELCAVYDSRPMLCRAYGFPVDAFAVESTHAIVFRSLCVLYDGMELSDYVRAKDLKVRLTELSNRLGGGRPWGRFTSPEAILARVEWA